MDRFLIAPLDEGLRTDLKAYIYLKYDKTYNKFFYKGTYYEKRCYRYNREKVWDVASY